MKFSDRHFRIYKALYYLSLFLISAVFILIFSTSTSPFTSTHGTDSAFFRLVGSGMRRGLLPYRNFFDMKGPYLYFIEYLGQLLVPGRIGILIIQILNMFFVMVIMSELCSIMAIKNYMIRYFMLAPFLWIYISYFPEGGNLTEEFSLVPIFLSVYLCFFYYANHPVSSSHPPVYALIYGICFGFLALIRITNAAVICAIVLTISVDIIIKNRWLNLLHNAISFIIGTAFAFSPPVVWAYCNGILPDMFYQVFLFGFKYSSDASIVAKIFALRSDPVRVLLLLLPFSFPCIFKIKDRNCILLLISSALATILSVSMGHNYPHYYILVLPVLYIIELFGVKLLLQPKTHSARKIVFLVIFFGVMAAQLTPFEMTINRALSLVKEDNNIIEQDSLDIAEYITTHKESVFCYETDLNFYTYTGLYPCIKYCGWQQNYISLVPSISDELTEIFRTTPPHWLILPASSRIDLPLFLTEAIDTNYSLIHINNHFLLFNLNY